MDNLRVVEKIPLYYDVKATFYFELTNDLVFHRYRTVNKDTKMRAGYTTPEKLLAMMQEAEEDTYCFELWKRDDKKSALVFDVHQLRQQPACDGHITYFSALAMLDFISLNIFNKYGQSGIRRAYQAKYLPIEITVHRQVFERQRVDFAGIRELPLAHSLYGAALLSLYDFTRFMTYYHSFDEVISKGYSLPLPTVVKPPLFKNYTITLDEGQPVSTLIRPHAYR